MVKILSGDIPRCLGDFVDGFEGFVGEKPSAENGENNCDGYEDDENGEEVSQDFADFSLRIGDVDLRKGILRHSEPQRLSLRIVDRDELRRIERDILKDNVLLAEAIRLVEDIAVAVADLDDLFLRTQESVFVNLIPDLVELR